MADIAKVSNVAAADIAKVNNVAKADIAKVGNTDMPAGGASLWCIVGADGGVATAPAGDLNDWTAYVSDDMGSADYNGIAYGKDGSGAGLWVAVDSNGNREIRYSSDPTVTDGWSDANVAGQMFGVCWGNNVWIAVGGAGKMHRSTNGGSTWVEIDLSGITGWDTATIAEVVSDGAGKWMCPQNSNIFHSTDDGATWSLLIDLADAGGLDIGAGFYGVSMAYTASRWCVFLWAAGGDNRSLVCHAAAADTSTWAKATLDDAEMTGQNLISKTARRMAGGGGTVIIVQSNAIARSTNAGQDWTRTNSTLPRTDARDVGTDGAGNWIAVHDSGRVSLNTSDGAPGSWVEQTGVQDGGSNTNLRFPTGGSNVEDLEAVAANVLLPV